MRKCTACKIVKPLDDFYQDKSTTNGIGYTCKLCARKSLDAWIAANPERARQASRNNVLKRRMAVLKHYGGDPPKCACCGESTYQFLSIDHVNGGGNRHRREKRGNTLFTWLIKEGFPPGYQILCHNCNQAKGYYGVCPHQTVKQENL